MDSGFSETLASSKRGHDVVRLPSRSAPKVPVSPVIASDDSESFKESDVVEKLVPFNSNLAYEQFINVAGG